MHPTWRDLGCPLAIEQATVKALLLVQRYPLTTSPVSGTRALDKGPLCQEEPETLTHFLLHCSKLRSARVKFLLKLLPTFRRLKFPVDPDVVIRVILDSTHLPEQNDELEAMCRRFVFEIHTIRSVTLGGDAGYTKNSKIYCQDDDRLEEDRRIQQ